MPKKNAAKINVATLINAGKLVRNALGAIRANAPTKSYREYYNTRSRAKSNTATAKRKRGPKNVSSNSGGKVSAGTKTFKRDKAALFMKKGIVKTQEYSALVDEESCVWVGHSTRMPQEELKMMCYAIVKKLYSMDSQIVTNFDRVPNTAVDSRIYLRFYEDSSTTTVTETFYQIAAIDTLLAVGNALSGLIIAQFNSGKSQFQILSIELKKLIGAAYVPFATIDISSSKVHFWCKSDLKVQNRTTNEVDKDADVVDNVPLYGKSYEGKGNGMVLKGQRGVSHKPFTANENRGYIEGVGSETATKEPPNGKAFMGVKKQGKLHFEPGQIKTSVLESEWSKSINAYIMECLRVGAGWQLQEYRLYSQGKFRVMALEKMINTNVLVEVSVGYEVNQKYGCWIEVGKNLVTQPLFQNFVDV